MSHVPEGPIKFVDRAGNTLKTASWLPRNIRPGDVLDVNGVRWRVADVPATHTARGIVAAGWSTEMIVDLVD